MKNLFTFLTLSVILFFPSLFPSQIPGMVNYSDEEGLNCSYTYHLRQDKNGFIWIGSDNGLFRFDGKEFKQYGKKEGLKNIDIISCEPLPNGEVFILPFLNDFAYLKNGRVINLNINEYVKNQFSSSIPKVTRDGNRLYLYGNLNPQNIFIYENGKVKKIPIPLEYGKRYFATLRFEPHTYNLYLHDPHQEDILVYNIITGKKQHLKAGTGSMICEKDDLFVFLNKNTIEVYQLSAPSGIKKISSYDCSPQENVFYGLIDKNNKLWLNISNGGVLYFNQSLTEKKRNLGTPIKILERYVINNVLVDKDDNVWFNSRNNGVFFISKSLFANHINLPVKSNSEYIKAIAKDNGNIILGYNQSAGALISRDNRIKNIILDKGDKDENISVYLKGNISIFGLSGKVIVHDIANNTSNKIYCSLKNIVPYTQDSLFFCTSGGLLTYSLKSKKTTTLFPERVYTVFPYDKDNLFTGSFSDLYKYNIRTRKKTLFLKGYYFTDIKKLDDHTYLGATNLNGIILFNTQGIIRKIGKNDGLINDQVKKIEVENNNTFWASTNSGISRVELTAKNQYISNFTQTDGLPSDAVAGCAIKNDTIFIGTSKGLGIFSIKKLLTQEKFIHKKVVINSVSIENNEHYDLQKSLTAYPHNTVIFNLSFLDYPSLGKISYKYKLEGLNNSWQINNSSKVIFNSIPPGKYTFRVYGLGYNGKQSYASSDLTFHIKPLFWQTWWFRLILAIVIIGTLLMIISSYLHKKKNKKMEKMEYEKKIAELELQAIKAQINPHFIYNCLNSIQFLLYKKDYRETENYLDIFAKMIRKTLYYSEKTFMPIKDEVEYLTLYLDMEKLRVKDLFDYKIIISEQVDQNWTIPSLLIQPFVENAIKHGISGLKDRKGEILISFDYTNVSLRITIEDNGIGISNQESLKKDNSFGVKLSHKRIETFKQLFDTNIFLEINAFPENNRQGTQIKLYIQPYEK
ncbi:histidine kinase [Chryseobacterium sp. WX]|uniref:sensor histidine kinase n=1 Tax=Chryseobacterium sp. WX TaxID=3031803 RepID=UPI00240A378D|nr:histidine kinase [Chryseobacterium sp. WX]WFB68837.1 histidine kinase [Chryseobacterium sp. WX]